MPLAKIGHVLHITWCHLSVFEVSRGLFVPEAAIVHKSVDGPNVAEWVEAEIRLRQVPRALKILHLGGCQKPWELSSWESKVPPPMPPPPRNKALRDY